MSDLVVFVVGLAFLLLVTLLTAILLGVIPAMLVNRFDRRNRRRRLGLCMCCGYDLTGNVSGVCPECGTGIERLDVDPRPSAP